MGKRTINRYLTLFRIFMSMAGGFWQKYKDSRSKASDGGAEVTTDEWIEIGNDMAMRFMESLPDIEAYIVLIPKDEKY